MDVAISRLAGNFSKNCVNKQKLRSEVLSVNRWFCSKEVSTGDGKTTVVGVPGSKEAGDISNVTPKEGLDRKGLLWNILNREKDFVPALYVYFPSGLGDAIIQATNNFNTLFKTKPVLTCVGRVKELEDCYKMRYVGVGKENVKISVKDGVLRVIEDGKEEDDTEKGYDDEKWGWSFGCYEKTLLLPKNAKPDEITAEVKDGVLNIVVPRIGIPKKEVKEIETS